MIKKKKLIKIKIIMAYLKKKIDIYNKNIKYLST